MMNIDENNNNFNNNSDYDDNSNKQRNIQKQLEYEQYDGHGQQTEKLKNTMNEYQEDDEIDIPEGL